MQYLQPVYTALGCMVVAVKQWAKFDVLVLWYVFLLNIQIFPLILLSQIYTLIFSSLL